MSDGAIIRAFAVADAVVEWTREKAVEYDVGVENVKILDVEKYDQDHYLITACIERPSSNTSISLDIKLEESECDIAVGS